MKIGIDIDEVVVEFVKGYLNLYNKKFNENASVKDFLFYNFWDNLKISKERAIDLIKEFYDSDDFDNLDFIDGAKEALIKLSEENELFFITSRHNSVEEKTRTFFNKCLPEISFELIFSGDFFGENKTKAEICSELNIGLMVEDNASYSLSCAKKGIKTFLLDKPWNQNCEEHENVTKVKNWKEILEILK